MIRNRIIIILTSFLFLMAINSCIKEDEILEGNPNRNINENIHSYADLFKVFWTVMDERYNYFYEQKRKDNMDWSNIYKEYYPKFLALQSYKEQGFSQDVIQADAQMAYNYFVEIIDPIIDGHFYVKIELPYLGENYFKGNMTNDKEFRSFGFDTRKEYMKDKLADDAFVSKNVLAGYLKESRGIFYLSFSEFNLTDRNMIGAYDYFVRSVYGNPLTETEIENSNELQAIQDVNLRSKVKEFSINMLKEWNDTKNSSIIPLIQPDIVNFNNEIKIFRNTEQVSPAMLDAAKKLSLKLSNLKIYNQPTTYHTFSSAEIEPYIAWFQNRMSEYFDPSGLSILLTELQNFDERTSFYTKFLNLLTKGQIKKMVLDLRDNGGGYSVDSRFFLDRLVTKEVAYGYQRTKEGTGRFNYTPWIEERTMKHKFGIPANIPIAVLTNRGTASMGEVTTLALKSQGPQVVSFGNFTAGAAAGLASFEEFNGGSTETFANKIEFYMPMVAFKDISGNVIEGIGIKPDIAVADPTDEEILAIKSTPKTFVDRVMAEAIKYLYSK